MCCTTPSRASCLAPFRLLGRSVLTALALVAFTAPALAQSTATGTIRGKVQNASNGTYVENVVVQVTGSSQAALTNNHGEYELRNVPAGEVTLQARYIGQSDQPITVTVPADGTVTQNFTLGTTENTRLDKDGVIQLDPFTVHVERFKNAAEIAINAERHSINIKNVVSTEEFGEIPGGNVGEFIKYLPGIELDYGGTYTAPTDATGISIRGFGSEDTAIMIDGVPVTAASQANLTNQVTLDMLSINNASRIELIKVPTPDMRMNSIGGQINLISKSAFEYAQPSFTYKAYVVVNSENPNPFDKVVGATDKRVYAGQPGFELSYIKPVNAKFGFSLTASRFSQYSANRRLRPEYGVANVNLDLRPLGGANNTPAANSVGPITGSNPFLTRVSITDSPRTSLSHSASMKIDYKPFDGLAITGNYQFSTYDSSDTDRRTQFRIQRPIDWSANHTYSQPYMVPSQSANNTTFNPSNSVSQDITSRDKSGNTHSGYLRANYRKGGWDITALANNSVSRASFHDFENGHFSGVDVSMSVGTVKFDDVVNGVPGKISVYDRTGLELKEIDYTKLANWGNPTIQGKRGNAESKDKNELYQFDLRRELDFIPTDVVRLAFKTGYLYEKETKIKWGLGTGYRETYVGPTITSGQILDDIYTGTSQGWGQPAQEFVSTYKLYDIWESNPEYFEETENDKKENYWSTIGQNKALFETNKAWYAQIEGSAIRDRLHFIAGLRDESRVRTGYGPQGDGKWNYVKNADGTLYRNEALLGGVGTVRVDQANSPLFAQNTTGTALRSDLASKGITHPAAVVGANSLERAMLERKTASFRGASEGDPNYSINLAFDVTKNLVAKLAYSVTSGRIKIEDSTLGILSGNQNDFRITEDDDRIDNGDGTYTTSGTISFANPNLLPESSKNWDLGLTYYTNSGGKIGASGYVKKIKNFTETFVTVAGDPLFDIVLTSIGLDPETYRLWEIKTSDNGLGTGEAWGYELEASQDLRFISALGELGRRIRFFANYSHSERPQSGGTTNRLTSRPSASNLASGGVTVTGNRYSFAVRANWRDYVFNGDKASFTQPDGSLIAIGEFIPAALKVDVTASYNLTKNTSIYLSARNVLEEGNDKQRYDALGIYPAYARWDDYRDTGVQITIGVSGRF
jgi:iron complex outermembrane receptor protein